MMEGCLDEHYDLEDFRAGAGMSRHMNINVVIAHRAGEILGGEPGDGSMHPIDDVTRSQLISDVVPTITCLAVLKKAHGLLESVEMLALTIRRKARKFDHVLKRIITHLPDAFLTRLGQEFRGEAGAMQVDADRLRVSSQR